MGVITQLCRNFYGILDVQVKHGLIIISNGFMRMYLYIHALNPAVV